MYGAVALFAPVLAGAASAAEAKLELVASGLELPLYAVSPPDETERVFVLEQHSGEIRILRPAQKTIQETPFLSLDLDDLATDGEQGLLGLAFHPEFAQNRLFFVSFTAADWATKVVRYEVSEADPDQADPLSAALVLRVEQPQTNHNGGWLGFGPDDGYLYVPLGDGGGGYDDDLGHGTIGNGQDPSVLLGKILRLDVGGADAYPADPDRNYAIPPDNPFVGQAGVAPEIWALGVRNPWRASFDRETDDFWFGDVGQDTREEIDFQPAASLGGENYGWRLREGTQPTPTVGGDRPLGNVDPIHEYPHPPGQCSGSVTGGYVYRGPIAAFQGLYFFSDFCRSFIHSLRFDGTNPPDLTDWTGTPEFTPDVGSIDSVASFGEDGAGNLYVVDHDGEVFRVPEPDAALLALAGVGSAALLARRPARRIAPEFW